MVKAGKKIVKYRILILILGILLLIPSALGYFKTRVNYDILSYLPQDLPSSRGEQLLEDPFQMAATSMLIVEGMPAGYTNRLIQDIKDIPHVSNAIWVSNLVGIQVPVEMIPASFRDMFFLRSGHYDAHPVRPPPAPLTRPWRPSNRYGGCATNTASWPASRWW